MDKKLLYSKIEPLILAQNREQQFHINLIKGQIGKELVRGILEKSGYKAYAFGYESLLSQMRYDVKKRRVPQTDSNNRLRSTPDLMVYDDDTNQTFFVEAKFSSSNDRMQARLSLRPLRWYKKYWQDSILVLVTPAEHVFYAQRITDLEISDNPDYRSFRFDINKQFLPIEKIFSRVTGDAIKQFQTVLEQFADLQRLDSEDADGEE